MKALEINSGEKLEAYELSRHFCYLLKDQGIDYWIMTGLEGLRPGNSRDLDILVSRRLGLKQVKALAAATADANHWHLLGVDVRGFGNYRIFFHHELKGIAFEIDLLPDFLFGPINICEGERDTYEQDGFTRCRNATFAKNILIKLLSGSSFKQSDERWGRARRYSESPSGRAYLRALFGDKVYQIFEALIIEERALRKNEKIIIIMVLIQAELMRNPQTLIYRVWRWVALEIRRLGAFGIVIPPILVSSTANSRFYELLEWLSKEVRKVAPIVAVEGIEDANFGWISRAFEVRKSSVSLNLAIVRVSKSHDVDKVATKRGGVFLDGDKFIEQADSGQFSKLYREAFEATLR